MARILSHVWSEVRGSIAGITYFPNQYHQIIARQRTSPVNPNTTHQEQIRDSFNSASDLWDQLTPGARAAWDFYSSHTPFSGPLGNYFLPGRLMFIRSITTMLYLNVRGHITNYPSPNDAPTVPGFPAFGPVTISDLIAPGTGFTIICMNNWINDATLYAFIEGPFQASRKRYKGPFSSEVIYSDNAGAGSLFNIVVDGLVEDGIYFIKLRMIEDIENVSSWALSPSQIIRDQARLTPTP